MYVYIKKNKIKNKPVKYVNRLYSEINNNSNNENDKEKIYINAFPLRVRAAGRLGKIGSVRRCVCVGFFRFTAARRRAGSNVPTGITYIIILYIYSIETEKITKKK